MKIKFNGKRVRPPMMTLYTLCGASQTFLLLADGVRWYRVGLLLVAIIGIFLECFVEDPRRQS